MSITIKEQFIKSIINDSVCVPSKAMREIFNNNWKLVSNEMLYILITESMHTLNDKFRLLNNLMAFADEEFRKTIDAYIKCRKYEYDLIRKKTGQGMKFVYNVYSMKYHEKHTDRCIEELSNHQGQCNRFIGTAIDLDAAQAMIILDHEQYREDEEDTHDTSYQLFYMVSKTLLFKEEYEDLDCSNGDIYFNKDGHIIDLFIYDFRVDEHSPSEKKYPIFDYSESVELSDQYLFKFKGIDRFIPNKKVKIYNSFYTRGLCNVTEKENYIIAYLNDNSFVGHNAVVRNNNKKTASVEAFPIQYIDLV